MLRNSVGLFKISQKIALQRFDISVTGGGWEDVKFPEKSNKKCDVL